MDGGGDARPWFSFFTTSESGLLSLAPDSERGFGGDLGGLAGADAICTRLARQSNAGDAKTWHAFLSTAGLADDPRVDAIDRVGEGPWFDFNGRLLANDLPGLLSRDDDGRPDGDPELVEMFSDEYGEPIRSGDFDDNHDVLTGSDREGKLFDDGADGKLATCGDWRDATLHGKVSDDTGLGGQIPVGHSWPRTMQSGREWISDHTINGCEPGVDTFGAGAELPSNFSVGGGGGYGAIYCFALGASPP
jgi:hypothetical protein